MTNTEAVNILENAYADFSWFGKQSEVFREKFARRFVAFKDKEILVTAATLTKLIERLDAKGIRPERVNIECVSRVKLVL